MGCTPSGPLEFAVCYLCHFMLTCIHSDDSLQCSGLMKVVRNGTSASPTTRYSVTVGGTHAAFGDVHKPCGFRLVKEVVAPASKTAGPSNNHGAAEMSPAPPPPLSQIGIVPTGIVTVTTANPASSIGGGSISTSSGSSGGGGGSSIDVSKLGPSSTAPLFNVRMVLPVPPDSEFEGTATLTGLEPATMFHSHSPGLEVLNNGDVLAVWFTSAGGGQEGECSITLPALPPSLALRIN